MDSLLWHNGMRHSTGASQIALGGHILSAPTKRKLRETQCLASRSRVRNRSNIGRLSTWLFCMLAHLLGQQRHTTHNGFESKWNLCSARLVHGAALLTVGSWLVQLNFSKTKVTSFSLLQRNSEARNTIVDKKLPRTTRRNITFCECKSGIASNP